MAIIKAHLETAEVATAADGQIPDAETGPKGEEIPGEEIPGEEISRLPRSVTRDTVILSAVIQRRLLLELLRISTLEDLCIGHLSVEMFDSEQEKGFQAKFYNPYGNYTLYQYLHPCSPLLVEGQPCYP